MKEEETIIFLELRRKPISDNTVVSVYRTNHSMFRVKSSFGKESFPDILYRSVQRELNQNY